MDEWVNCDDAVVDDSVLYYYRTLDDFGEHVRLATIQGYRISLTV
jgi:hypothetical protein